jgi:integration host factor subunit alpha
MTDDAPNTLTRAHLADAIHRTTGLPRSDGLALVACFLDIASETLCRSEPVLLSGFGKFVVLERAARKGRNVKLGIDVEIAPRLAVVFRPAPTLVSKLNAPSRATVQPHVAELASSAAED